MANIHFETNSCLYACVTAIATTSSIKKINIFSFKSLRISIDIFEN